MADFKLRNIKHLKLKGIETVYILDYAASPSFVGAVAAACDQVVIIDHHISARDALLQYQLPSNVSLIYDLNKCGATLAYEYFRPTLTSEILYMLKLVEDSDLWRLEFPETHAFRAGMYAMRHSWDARSNPEIFEYLMSLDLETILHSGRQIHQAEKHEVECALSNAFIVDLTSLASWGHCLAVQGSQFIPLRSLIGHRLAEESLSLGMRGIGIVACIPNRFRNATRLKLSFRSIPEEDTTRITIPLGGGGHRNASSCTIKTKLLCFCQR